MSKTLSLSLTDELKAYLDTCSGDGTLYATPSEYVRDLIRKDREAGKAEEIRQSVMRGYEDLAAGRVHEWKGMDDALRRGRELLAQESAQ